MKEEAKYLLNRLNEFDSAEDQSLKLANYKDKRREYKSLIKRKKKEYEHKKKLDIADDFRNKDFKKFWGYIKNDCGRRNVNTQAVPEADSWPDYLNNLEGVCADLQEVAHTPEMVIYPMREHDYDLVGDVNGQEIKSIFKNLKGGTAAGVDGIPILLFKNFLSILIPIIVLLCNKVLRSGQWPSAWKTSLFIPLFKRGNPKAHENYRLIALVPALSKVLEKILDTRLSNWLNTNNLIHEEQGGFRTGYGTTDSVFILKALIDKYGKGKTCLYVGFLDLHKAFDSVDRELLKDAMLNIGLPHSFVRLIVSMYTCVSGIIQVGNRFSKLFDIKRGVKQGSTLSPKLFNIFINDVVNFLENRWAPKVSLGTQKLSLLLFADDIALVANKPQDLQTLLNLIDEYLHIKKLRLNTEKSENDLDLLIAKKDTRSFKKALFPTELRKRDYHVVDVVEGQLMVCVNHDQVSTNLYTAPFEDVEQARFALSLENIYYFYPESTTQSTWIKSASTDSFVDIHKVRGLRGTYIASQLRPNVTTPHVTPEDLVTVITFDMGGEWKPIQSPRVDDEGQPIKCQKNDGCSLHLSQRLTMLYPSIRTVPIVSSSSAIGILMATGVLGKSFKGHPGLFISSNGGSSWRQILKGNYFYAMGDYGGVLVAVKYYKSNGLTNEMIYSLDEGIS
ncbi:hypothetical protein QYM36_015555 [Artemia franciscana]|uniref:Reverse transcriptase domain-containing protein n=1 Tax=Artemia franciscana TaxID=6661 RepID=A0AA88KXG6_ARTSF|nr:hypothetical protein QYM36_015555 [Artemia franciscana]